MLRRAEEREFPRQQWVWLTLRVYSTKPGGRVRCMSMVITIASGF